MRSLAVWLAAALLVLLTGCATTAAGGPKTAVQRADPWENWNRKVYAFNDSLDEAVLKQTQSAVVLENLIGQFLYNKAADTSAPASGAK